MMTQLSVIIPARNEIYLQDTIEDVKRNSELDTEILWEEDTEGIGQRALQNKLARKAQGEYIMKLDAHCSLQQGFDRKFIERMDKDTVMTGMLCRLDAKNWSVIPRPFTKKYYFDTNMVFQYAKKEEEGNDWGLVDTMSLQGSLFVVDKERYFEWNLCDESYGSWGFQGSEVACKTWFNGGRVVTNTDVFYGHLFRGKGQSVEEIPYDRPQHDIDKAHDKALELLKHPKMPWLIKKFNYPGDWTSQKVEELCLS